MPLLLDPFSNAQTTAELIGSADLVIGTVLIPGASAPKLITRAMLGMMRPGAVIVDVSIDQGGCCETSPPTTHAEPTYVVDGVVHYCVANMPGAVARTSTMALSNATFPYVMALANKGWKQACLDDVYLRGGANVIRGAVTWEPVSGREIDVIRRGLRRAEHDADAGHATGLPALRVLALLNA